MRKILIATLEYPPQVGGISSYVYNFARALPGEKVVFYSLKQRGDKEFDQKNSWKIYRQTPYYFLWWPRWLKMVWQMMGIVRREKIESIHVHHVLPVGYVAWIIKKFYKIPYKIFLHGTDLALVVHKNGKRKKFLKLCSAAEEVIVNSEFMRAKLYKLSNATVNAKIVYPCPANSFFVEPNIDAVNELRHKLGLAGKKVLLSVARLSPGKGFGRLTALLPQIMAEVPNLVWVVAGDGPRRKSITDFLGKSGLLSTTRVLGEVKAEILPNLYQLADVFTLLGHAVGEREEGLGMAFLEAAASGIPAVAGRTGGVGEAVINGETGIVVDSDNEAECVQAIIKLLKDSSEAKRLGDAARVRIRNEFSWEEQMKKINL